MSIEDDLLLETERQAAIDKAAKETAEKEAQAAIDKAAKETAEKEAQAAIDKAAKETAEQEAQAAIDKAAKETAEKEAQAAIDKAAKETAEKEAQAAIDKAEDEGVSLFLEFLDFAGKPIVGLKYRVIVGKTIYNGATNEKGHATVFSGLGSHQELEILVKKDDGQFASKFKGFTACNDMSVCAVSPHIKIELETELHKGVIGSAPAPKETPTPIKAPAIPGAGQISGGGKHTETKPKTGRNDAGNPQAELKEKTSDWNARHFIPTFLIWSWDDFKHKIGWTTPAIKIDKDHTKTGGDNTASSTSATSPSTNGKGSAALKVSSLDQAVPEEVTELIKIMEVQATWQWDVMLASSNSATIATGLTKKQYEPILGKNKNTTAYRCYPSVKIGLLRAKLVSGINGDVPAKGAGPWLLAQGFKDITKSLPDGRWAMPGDVIVYRYTDAIEAANIKKFEKVLKAYEKQKADYAERKVEYKKELDIWTTGAAQRKNDEAEAKKNKKKYQSPKAPKLGAEPTKPDDENYGHIDVRSYDGYMSDFMADKLGPAERYVVTGIYRKVFDPLPDLRVRAFLKVIREWECHSIADDSRRYFAFQRHEGDKGQLYFSDTSTHPYSNRPDAPGSFSGAYQMKYATWKELVTRYGMPVGFTPELQDRFAVAKIEYRHALGLIRQGKIREAIVDTKLTQEWSSLAGGIHARKGKSLDDLLMRYNQNLAELIRK